MPPTMLKAVEASSLCSVAVIILAGDESCSKQLSHTHARPQYTPLTSQLTHCARTAGRVEEEEVASGGTHRMGHQRRPAGCAGSID